RAGSLAVSARDRFADERLVLGGDLGVVGEAGRSVVAFVLLEDREGEGDQPVDLHVELGGEGADRGAHVG
ncbi:hypothetical protein ABE10_01005, partial [Bacillus toyonensis]|nr:hypothetical protein [Bacillus toyonensis]